jgi:ADP-heptose:LPS heptosyltransferase
VNSPAPPPSFFPKERVLVIKLGALGDFVQAFGPFAAIRAQHPHAHITLLTTPPFAALARRSPWFDAVDDNGRPGWRDAGAVWRLVRLLRGGFGRVYDLQTSARSSRYRWLVGQRAAWSGVASHRSANPHRDTMHTADRQRDQLQHAGITHFPPPALDWLDADVTHFALPEEFALLSPGPRPRAQPSAGRSKALPRWRCPGPSSSSAVPPRRRWPPPSKARST